MIQTHGPAPRTISPDEASCVLHASHSPAPIFLDLHHVWPLGWGGPDEPRNLKPCCPHGHQRVHALLRLYERYKGMPPWKERARFGPKERALADRGWRSYQEGRLKRES